MIAAVSLASGIAPGVLLEEPPEMLATLVELAAHRGEG
jgi:hypothetical protein